MSESEEFMTNYSLFVIPSWRRVIRAPMGNYANRPVTLIQSDPIIFFCCKEVSKHTDQGTLYFLFGLGYYYTQFQLKDQNYILDNRPLTGIILSDFVYDELATSKPIALNDDLDVILNELAFKIPIYLSESSEQKRLYIKGTLIRNVFLPFKDVFVEMMEKIRNSDMFRIESTGHKLLSTELDHFNAILTTDKIKASGNSNYLDDMPGISQVTFWAEDLLQSFFNQDQLQELDTNISLLQRIYEKIELDPMDLYTILQSAVEGLQSEDQPFTNSFPYQKTNKKGGKRSLFLSAENRINQIATWPAEIEREPLENILKSSNLREDGTLTNQPDMKSLVHKLHTEMNALDEEDAADLTVSKVDEQRETFEFSKMQKTIVQEKDLPPTPENEFESIFTFLEDVISQNYDMRSVGNAFETARVIVQKMDRQSKYIWQLSKYMNKYILKEPGVGLSEHEKQTVYNDVDLWLKDILEEKRKEAERLEQERLERERIAAEQAEQERLERERIAVEQAEQERLERERIAAEQAERERIAAELEEKERLEREQLVAEQAEQERLEQERLIQERNAQEIIKMEQARLEQEHIEKERIEHIQNEKIELKKHKETIKLQIKERKEREKAEKKRQKELQKIEKEKQKLEKIKAKEAAKANKRK